LLDELRQRYTIDLYHDSGYLPYIGLRSSEFGCYNYRLFEGNARVLGYHALVYQMGNSHFHGYMYDILLRHPGIVTLHDLCLVHFHQWYARQPGVDGDTHIRTECEAYFGADTDDDLSSLVVDASGGMLGMLAACIPRGYHVNGRIFESANAVIVHSPWCIEQVRNRFPKHLDKTFLVAFGATAVDPSLEQRRALRARLQLPSNALIVASLGLIHPAKMNADTITSFAPLAADIPEALLIFAGNELDFGEARRKVDELGLQRRVRFLGHYPGDLAELASVVDIGVCLRRPPTFGETSAALIDLLRLGVPTIVSDVGTFSGYPDSVVCKHRMDADGTTGLTRALRELAEDRPRREALGRAAWRYIQQNNAWSDAADSYAEIIERVFARRTRTRTGGLTATRGPQSVNSSERLQAAS
jgi:glycosyltransferase involved in cell wall biosynthesis